MLFRQPGLQESPHRSHASTGLIWIKTRNQCFDHLAGDREAYKVQQSGKVGVLRTKKRSGPFRAVGFLLSLLLALASLPHEVTAHSAHVNGGLSAETHHSDVGSNDAGKRKSSASGHCMSIVNCLSCLPAPEQGLQARASGVTYDFSQILVHRGPTLEQELPPPRLWSQV